MKSIFWIPFFIIFYSNLNSQIKKVVSEKPPIGFETFGKWPYIINCSISDDGKYAYYKTNYPSANNSKITLKSIKENWVFEEFGSECYFAKRSKIAILKNSGDSLCIIELGLSKVEYIPQVTSFKVSNGSSIFLAYLSRNQNKVIIRNLETGYNLYIDSASEFYFNGDNKHAIVKSTLNRNGYQNQSLILVDLVNKSCKKIWETFNNTSNAIHFIFSDSTSQFAFLVDNKVGSRFFKSVWFFDGFNDQAINLLDSNVLSKMSLDLNGLEYNGLNERNRRLFVNFFNKKNNNTLQSAKVDVWSFKDKKLQSEQLSELEPRTFVGIINLTDYSVRMVEEDDETLITKNKDYGILIKREGANSEFLWNKASSISIYLISFQTGIKKLINSFKGTSPSFLLMPGGKYFIYYNPDKRNYFSYEISTGINRNITAAIKTIWTTYVKRDIPKAPYMPIGIAGATKNDESVLIYDQCDVYQIDPLAQRKPINITNSFGKKNNIEFRMALENGIFNENEEIILSAFNRRNKNDGFYKARIGRTASPILLTSQQFIFKGTFEDDRFYPIPPVKANNADIFLVRRMSATESPNYFWTIDFIKYNRITDVKPEKEFNWLTTELIEWKKNDGSLSQGVLYKPENFDNHKKYPVIFYYYENLTEGLNAYLSPEFTQGTLNIPYYVSNGYVVFTPDVTYNIGYPGKSVLNTIISAVKYLSKFQFVDIKHIGIQGHSRGGWETNYLITNTNIFSAAMSASGFCNYVNLYNGIQTNNYGGGSRQGAFEFGYQRIGQNLWENPRLYIENSPIFHANKIKTPLLMMNNKEDSDIPFEQGIQFFTALRRLGKTVWMLQYDGQDHIVTGKAKEDLEIRMKQFFDHYLKGAIAPKWMTCGIPAFLKNIETGYQLDPKGSCNKECIVCKGYIQAH